jgi:quinol-cytochrome oxidoreductase complex cytochrome b subunit
LWGGFSVGNATLNRFFSLHYILPFIIVVVILLHLALLHEVGSNNPLGVDSVYDRVNFYPYFLIKDFFTFICIFIIYIFIVCFYPDVLGHADNYLKANPLVTPTHIVPE